MHTKQEIEDFVTKTRALALCADLCNATKHLVLSRPPRSGQTPTLAGRHISVHLSESLNGSEKEPHPILISMQFAIDEGGKTVDAFAIAEDAPRACESFVS